MTLDFSSSEMQWGINGNQIIEIQIDQLISCRTATLSPLLDTDESSKSQGVPPPLPAIGSVASSQAGGRQDLDELGQDVVASARNVVGARTGQGGWCLKQRNGTRGKPKRMFDECSILKWLGFSSPLFELLFLKCIETERLFI